MLSGTTGESETTEGVVTGVGKVVVVVGEGLELLSWTCFLISSSKSEKLSVW